MMSIVQGITLPLRVNKMWTHDIIFVCYGLWQRHEQFGVSGVIFGVEHYGLSYRYI